MSTPKVITFGNFNKTDPNWLQSKIIDPKILLPGGIRLAVTPFTIAPFVQTDGRVFAPSGTPVFRTLTDRANNVGYRPLRDADVAAITPATLPTYQITITLHDRWDLRDDNQADGLQPLAGNLILENFLPNQTLLTPGVRSVLRMAGFVLMIGRE